MTWVVIALVVGSLAHGALGFGLPLIATPMIALVTDVQTAVLVTLLPNLAVNIVSVLRGGRWRASIARHWPVAVYVVIGTAVGTRLLLVTDPEPLELLLAGMMVVYLLPARLGAVDASWLSRHPRKSEALFGLLGGLMSGAVNVAVPPLVIYFMAIGLDALAMTQILNLCFLAARLTQAATLSLSNQLGALNLLSAASLTAASLVALSVGSRLQRHIRAEVFRVVLRSVLWVMAVVLVAKVVRHWTA